MHFILKNIRPNSFMFFFLHLKKIKKAKSNRQDVFKCIITLTIDLKITPTNEFHNKIDQTIPVHLSMNKGTENVFDYDSKANNILETSPIMSELNIASSRDAGRGTNGISLTVLRNLEEPQRLLVLSNPGSN